MAREGKKKADQAAYVTPPYEMVRAQIDSWRQEYEKNDRAGKNGIMFAQVGDQWDQSVVAGRALSNKECLTFNMLHKHSQRMKAQAEEIEFSLDLAPTTDSYQDNIEETSAFRLMLENTVLSDDVLDKGSAGLSKCVDYGYAALQVDYEQENDQTLCLAPILRVIRDPSTAFFDKNAPDATCVLGRFCGIEKYVTKSDLLLKMPELIDSNYLMDEKNEFIDYWHRWYEPANYVKLEGGVYKREDLLTEDDISLLGSENRKKWEIKVKPRCRIYHVQYCNGRVIQEGRLFPTDDLLPIVYHFALTIWHPDMIYTFPMVYGMVGAQKLLNFLNSQIATMSKSSTADKWLGNPDHVQTPDQILSAKNINTSEGFFNFGKSDQPLVRYQSSEIPASVIQMAQVSKQMIDEISGAMIDTENAQSKVISGVALDKITHNTDLLKAPIVAAHIQVMNTVGKIYRQMIPKLFTEERTVMVKRSDGTGEAIVINKKLVTGKIKNNIKDIDNNFHYEIKAGPSSTMEKDNVRVALQEIYKIKPQYADATIDLYVRCLGTHLDGELSRRVQPFVDPLLVKYSRGEVSEKDFQAYQAQQKQQAMQMQQQSPDAIYAQAEVAKAQVGMQELQIKQYIAETKRQETLNKAIENQGQLQLEYFKIISQISADREDAALKQQARVVELEMERNNNIINGLMNASTR